MDRLSARLAHLGLVMAPEAVARAWRLLELHGVGDEALSDLQLMTICVGAYRDPDSELPHWV